MILPIAANGLDKPYASSDSSNSFGPLRICPAVENLQLPKMKLAELKPITATLDE